MSTTFPEIRDVSVLSGMFFTSQFLTIGVEGQSGAGGTATVGTPYEVSDVSQAVDLFDDTSNLTSLITFLLNRGLNSVWAVSSANDGAPDLAERQTAWEPLNENADVRILLTDDTTQATLVALAEACEDAETIQNKQFCVVAIANPTTKANLTAAAAAIASKRAVLVGPSVYDEDGTLLSGQYAAAYAAAEIAKNPDITDDLDGVAIPNTTGIEKDTNGMPLLRIRINGGTPTNDFSDLLDDGVSPFQQGRNGQAEFVHLRTTFTTDDTYDALMTLLIMDQSFIEIRSMLLDQKFLRRGNTESNRALAGALTNQWLSTHRDWIEPANLPDGKTGYGVTVTPSEDRKKMTISYKGVVVRNNQKIDVNGVLTIPV